MSLILLWGRHYHAIILYAVFSLPLPHMWCVARFSTMCTMVFFTLFKLYEWCQIAQSTKYMNKPYKKAV